MKKRAISWVMLLQLQIGVCIYTLSGVAAKFASRYAFLSLGFILCYGIEILILGVYAVLWQQIIKRVDISIAYANRALAIFWSMLWAALLFQEAISVTNLLGVGLILAGTWMVNQNE